MPEASSGANTAQGRPPRMVLGGGYDGVYTALGLQKAARRGQIELTLISRDNFFLFQPLLAEVVSGSIEPNHVINPIRRLCRFTSFHQAEIEAVDVQERTVVIILPPVTRTIAPFLTTTLWSRWAVVQTSPPCPGWRSTPSR